LPIIIIEISGSGSDGNDETAATTAGVVAGTLFCTHARWNVLGALIDEQTCSCTRRLREHLDVPAEGFLSAEKERFNGSAFDEWFTDLAS
jgi:hypothetical protein